MSNKKITDLPVLATFADDDVLPIVDVSANVTKQSYIQDLATRFSQGLQSTLISGTNIKTINSTSLLGSGDISIDANPSGSAGSIQFSDGSAFASDSNLFWDNTNKRLGVGTNTPSALFDVQNSTNGALLARFKDNINALTYLDIKANPILTDYIGLYFGADFKILSKPGGALFLNISNNVAFSDGLSTKVQITPSEVNIGSISGARLGIKGSGSTSATTSLLVQNSSGTEILKVDDGENINLRSTVLINHPTISSRVLRLGWGSVFGDDAGSELMIGADFDNNTSPRMILAGSVRSTGANTIQLMASSGVSVASSLTSPNSSAQLDISSTTKGFLPPRMTTTERDAISTPATGLQVYDTDTATQQIYDGTSWRNTIQGDNTNLVWDNTNKRLGIGTNTPLFPLVVQSGAANSTLASFQNSTNPTQNLSIIKQFDSLNIFKIGTDSTGFQIYENSSLGLFVGNFSTAKLSVINSGNVGVGETSPTARLQVKGSGSTSATTSLLVQNGNGYNLLRIRDDGNIFCEGGGQLSSVGIIGTVYGLFGGASYEASASLVCGGTNRGFLPPRMTTTQKNAISSPASGLMVYDTDTNKLCCYNGTSWNDLF